jgi:hypothetical protein
MDGIFKLHTQYITGTVNGLSNAFTTFINVPFPVDEIMVGYVDSDMSAGAQVCTLNTNLINGRVLAHINPISPTPNQYNKFRYYGQQVEGNYTFYLNPISIAQGVAAPASTGVGYVSLFLEFRKYIN